MANGIFVHDASAKHLNESSGFLMVAAERGGFCFFFFLGSLRVGFAYG